MKFLFLSFLLLLPVGGAVAQTCGPALANKQKAPEICIGTPKLWLYDRMYPMLDGLMRDVEGVSLSSLTGLDANAVNTRVADLLQSFIQASASVDATAGITNAFNLDAFNATRNSQLSQIKNQSSAAQVLAQENATITQSLAAALDAETKRTQALPPNTTCAQDTQCLQLQNTVANLTTELASLKAIANPAVTPAGPTLNGVSAPALTTPSQAQSPQSFVTGAFNSALTGDGTAVGSIPARERLDNFITLLNDRLTKQLALSLDEAGMTKDYIPVIVELDVYAEPHKDRKNEVAGSLFSAHTTWRMLVERNKKLEDEKLQSPWNISRIDREIEFNKTKIRAMAKSCNKPVLVYNLYPTMAAFNVSNVSGKSTGFVLNGGFKGLLFGNNFAWQRQRDHVSESMMQSVYVNGFREGDSTFGWYYGAPAYTSTVRPGGYSTFALLLVPSGSEEEGEVNACSLEIEGGAFWKNRRDRIETANPPAHSILSANDKNPSMASIEHVNSRPMISQVQYAPHYGASDALAKDLNTISLEFVDPVNPNLLLEASGKLLKRVRDWRGRATSPGANTVSISDSDGNAKQVSLARGLFEADIDEANTWIAVSRTKIMIKLDSATAGTNSFPDLRFLIPGAKDWSLTDLMDYRTYESTITIGDSTFLACHPKPAAFLDPAAYASRPPRNDGCMQQPLSMWLPLFVTTPSLGHSLQVIPTTENAPDNTGVKFSAASSPVQIASLGDTPLSDTDPILKLDQYYIYVSADYGMTKLRDSAQVTVTGPGHRRFAHPIAVECAALGPGLLCHLHPATTLFSSWRDEPKREDGTSEVHCLDTDGEDGSLRLVYHQQQRVCDWTQYVLQLRVIQPASNLDSQPTLVLSVPLTANTLRSTKLAIVGPAQSASQVIKDTPPSRVKGKIVAPAIHAVNLKFKFPIYNPPSDTSSNVCLGDALGNFVSDGKVLVVRPTPDPGSVDPPANSPDETGKPTKGVGTVEIEIAAAGLPGLLDNKHLFLDCSPPPEKAEAEAAKAKADAANAAEVAAKVAAAAAKTAAAKAAAAKIAATKIADAKTAAAKADAAKTAAAKAGLVIDPAKDLGPLIGMRELISPANVQLSISGTNKAFYQFSGNNLDFVTGVLVGTDTNPAPVRHTDGGLLADLSAHMGKGTDALLRFAIDKTELAPLVLACPAQTPAPATPKDNPAPAAATTNTATVQVTNVTNVNTPAPAATKTPAADKKDQGSTSAPPTCGPIYIPLKAVTPKKATSPNPAAVAAAVQTPNPGAAAAGAHNNANPQKTSTGTKKKGAKSTSTG